jgi:DNA-binding MarR family transcriptional regulator
LAFPILLAELKTLARKKRKGTELSVFKGREAKLNRAILLTIVQKSPQIIYDVTKIIRKQKGFKHTKYTNVSRRVKALEQQGYLEKAGNRKTQAGAQGILYQLTTRAHVALFLNKVNLDTFIKKSDEDTLMAELAALTLFFEKTAWKIKPQD